MASVISLRLLGPLVTTLTASVLAGCTKPAPVKVDPADYARETSLMLNIGNKFASEGNIERMHEKAVDTEAVRLFKCIGYGDVCSAYGQYLAAVIRVSADGTLTQSERHEMNEKLVALQSSIQKNKP